MLLEKYIISYTDFLLIISNPTKSNELYKKINNQFITLSLAVFCAIFTFLVIYLVHQTYIMQQFLLKYCCILTYKYENEIFDLKLNYGFNITLYISYMITLKNNEIKFNFDACMA